MTLDEIAELYELNELGSFQNKIIDQAFVYISNGVTLFKNNPLSGLESFSTGILLIAKNIPNYKFVITLDQLKQNEKLLNDKKKPTITIGELQEELDTLKHIINIRTVQKGLNKLEQIKKKI